MSTKQQKIQSFIEANITDIDLQLETEQDLYARLKLTVRRSSYAKMMGTYFGIKNEIGKSHLKQAEAYYNLKCYDQAMLYAELSRQNVEEDPQLLEAIHLSILRCLLKSNRVEQAAELIEQICACKQAKQFLELKIAVKEQGNDEKGTMECLDQLQEEVRKEHTVDSAEMGLFLIQKGDKLARFLRIEEGLEAMCKGIHLLIQFHHKDKRYITSIYLKIADNHRKLHHFQSQYSSLVCAHSLIRKDEENLKQTIQVIHKIARNLLERGEKEKALQEFLRVYRLEKQFYGDSEPMIGKTLKIITELLMTLERRAEAKRYEQEYLRIVGSNENRGKGSFSRVLNSRKENKRPLKI